MRPQNHLGSDFQTTHQQSRIDTSTRPKNRAPTSTPIRLLDQPNPDIHSAALIRHDHSTDYCSTSTTSDSATAFGISYFASERESIDTRASANVKNMFTGVGGPARWARARRGPQRGRTTRPRPLYPRLRLSLAPVASWACVCARWDVLTRGPGERVFRDAPPLNRRRWPCRIHHLLIPLRGVGHLFSVKTRFYGVVYFRLIDEQCWWFEIRLLWLEMTCFISVDTCDNKKIAILLCGLYWWSKNYDIYVICDDEFYCTNVAKGWNTNMISSLL